MKEETRQMALEKLAQDWKPRNPHFEIKDEAERLRRVKQDDQEAYARQRDEYYRTHTLTDPMEEARQRAISENGISDFMFNTGSRIRNGDYMGAFNGLVGGLTEIGQGFNHGGMQRSSPKPTRFTDHQKLMGFSRQEMGKMYPQGEYVFKGGKFNPQSWDITKPGFVAPDLDGASGWAGTEGRISIAPVASSKTLKTGKSFVTPHLQETKRSKRIEGTPELMHSYGYNRKGRVGPYYYGDRIPKDGRRMYEAVLPGNEMAEMPWETWKRVYVPGLNPEPEDYHGDYRFIPMTE